MMAHTPDTIPLLKTLHRTLIRRWVVRLGVWAIAATLWGWAAGTLFASYLHWGGYASQIAGALFGGCVALVWIMKRIPRPSMRDAALFAEAHGDARGAVELTLANTSEHVVRQATNTLNTLSTDEFPPLLTLRAAILCGAGTMAALLLSLTLPESKQVSYPPPERKNTSPPARTRAVTLSDTVLSEFHDKLLGASPDQQEAARKRYAELWGQREKQINDLGNAAAAGHEAAAKGDAEEMARAASAQRKAVVALSSGGLPMPDMASADSSLTSAQLNAQSDAIANLARELDEAAALAHELLQRANMSLPVRGTLEERCSDPLKPGEGTRITGELSSANSGVIAIARDVWKGQQPESESGVPMTPRETAVVDKYRAALGDK